LHEFCLWTVFLLVENHEFTIEFFTQPFDELEAKSGKSVFLGNDKTLDIAADNSFQNGVKLSPPKIESRSNLCDDQEFLDGTSPRIYPWNQSQISNRKSSSPLIYPWGQSKISNRKSKID
jgi:hypothetical protein